MTTNEVILVVFVFVVSLIANVFTDATRYRTVKAPKSVEVFWFVNSFIPAFMVLLVFVFTEI